MSKSSKTSEFILSDLPRTLFPLRTDLILAEHATSNLDEYVYQRALNKSETQHHFLSQQRVYAEKPNHHLRRTVKLDPISSWFMYDIVYRHRGKFRAPVRPDRQHFGFRFIQGIPIPGRRAYSEYRTALIESRQKYKHELSFDIAAYFNTIYHHDIVNWFRSIALSTSDADNFSLFLRETNAGRSIDCLPQGLYPCKMIGNAYLTFLDTAQRIKCTRMIRFMDDIHIFDDNEGILFADFDIIQRLLGDKGLSANPHKTHLPGSRHLADVRQEIDAMKIGLLQIRQKRFSEYDDEYEETETERTQLTPEQRAYLLDLLRRDPLEEEDAELVLSLIQTDTDLVVSYVGAIFSKFPNLAKTIHWFCQSINSPDQLWETFSTVPKMADHLGEFQLFWLAAIVEDYLLETPQAGSMLLSLYEHPNATAITRAKILEIPENRFGMPELREEHLKTGRSDWQAWAAAIGTRNQPKAQRNYFLKYFSTGSSINALVGETVLSLQ